MSEATVLTMAEAEGCGIEKSTRKARKCKFLRQVSAKDEIHARFKQIRDILKKSEEERTSEETNILKESPEVVKAVQKRDKIQHAQKQRELEIEDEPDILKLKCQQLANAIKASSKIVIYTGAGISTAASIPDYRGPNGVWTLLKQGKELQAQDLCDAEPTYTHMGITQLYREGHLKHVVSQNCDGLHIRSGLTRKVLSEVHGNMFIEQCKECKPHREYIRLFDVTERTGVRRHETGRKCHKCNNLLQDTIVHFGEKGGLKSPYRWKEAVKAANNCDLILCLGSSLKLLKKYSCLWCMNLQVQKRPKLYIVNLQWTPKDNVATLKINGRCDDVMQQVISCLGYSVPAYKRELDPLFSLSTPLRKKELKTTSKKILAIPEGYIKPAVIRRKPLAKDKKSKYSTIKNLLGHQQLQKDELADSKTSLDPTHLLRVDNPSSISCDMLDSVLVKAEHPNISAMQDSDKCFRLSGVYTNHMLIPQVIPSLHVPVAFQSAVLATDGVGGHDLKLVSVQPAPRPRETPVPVDVPTLPGSVILDHCYCRQINCQCQSSPEKSPQTTVAPSISSVQYSESIQDQALDLSPMSSSLGHPLDLSPQAKIHHCVTANLLQTPHVARSEQPHRDGLISSGPPGLVLAASLNPGETSFETFGDLQKFCMMGFPPSFVASPPIFHSQPILSQPPRSSPSVSSPSVSTNNAVSGSRLTNTAGKVKEERDRLGSLTSEIKQEKGEQSDVKDEETKEKCAPRTKRRLSSASSVPGWFGKGLAIKKRRKF
ncbi:uncharacterized protein [Haliotis asinina]|uniref:uncharacterized protein n=1 Tax=Haliotis asinina TaxID=109174 RepID=UPI0035323A7D